MKMRRWLVPIFALALVGAACGDDDDGDDGGGTGVEDDTGSINLLTAMEPEEVAPIQAIFDEMITADADYEVEVEASGQFEEQLPIRAEGGTLDLAAVPQPGAVVEMAARGQIVSLEDLGFDIDELNDRFGEAFMALGEYEGEHYGLPTNINLKSMVWYPADDFDEAGYEVPETWDELLALSQQIIDDGNGAPWCIGFESEGASGWPATDWMEDIVLRTAGGDTYDQWVAHEIPFDDPAIVNAAEVFGEVLFADGFVLGGVENTPNIAFGDAPTPMFDEPTPGCWLHRQASFINSFFPEDAVAGEDYDWFPLPPIDQEGTLFAGELTVAGSNRAEVVDFLEQFIDVPVQCEMGGIVASSRISPNVNVGPECYANDILADASVVLAEGLSSGTARFDASDLMPPEVGQGAFWTGMLQLMTDGPDSIEAILADIDAAWPEE